MDVTWLNNLLKQLASQFVDLHLFCALTAYPSVCDSQGSKNQDCAPSVPQSDGDASRLERKFVHKVYEEIADHFSNTRHSPWPKVVEFLKSLPRAAIVADIGCGNGKYLGVNQELCMVRNTQLLT